MISNVFGHFPRGDPVHDARSAHSGMKAVSLLEADCRIPSDQAAELEFVMLRRGRLDMQSKNKRNLLRPVDLQFYKKRQ